MIEQYIQSNEIKIEDLPVVEPYIRKLLLSWIGKAMAKKDRTIKTEHGKNVRVILEDERIRLHAEDGVLDMPKATFQFVDEEVKL